MHKGKNIVSIKNEGEYLIERRRVYRRGMKDEVIYELKIPKTIDSFIRIYGADELLRLAIASLRTENDDEAERSGRPISRDKLIMKRLRNLSSDELERLFKVLEEENE